MATTARAILGNLPTGVMVLTSRGASGKAYGATVNSFASVTLDPPTLLISLVSTSRTRQAVSESGAFVLNILSADQIEIAKAFAGSESDHTRRFETATWQDVEEGAVLSSAVASFRCRTLHSIRVATHRLYVGEVVDAAWGDAAPGEPLVSYRRSLFVPSERADWSIGQ
ncbi:flavin reductase family protein [Streptomyces fuscichromogenes]|uniref:flavin reductase family protein n=1 Tax=Streptomyces fuscichromogenes TaxID=1324013 RepID=UPI0016704B2F|nr:flavin reductase family protein [Streptomyces fuscichromogenes]